MQSSHGVAKKTVDRWQKKHVYYRKYVYSYVSLHIVFVIGMRVPLPIDLNSIFLCHFLCFRQCFFGFFRVNCLLVWAYVPKVDAFYFRKNANIKLFFCQFNRICNHDLVYNSVDLPNTMHIRIWICVWYVLY